MANPFAREISSELAGNNNQKRRRTVARHAGKQYGTDRNLNTGRNNYDESKGVVAHNAVHHSKQFPSQITVTVVKR